MTTTVEKGGLSVLEEATYFRLQPEGRWMGRRISPDEVLDGLNAQLNDGDIDGFLRSDRIFARRITSYWQAIAKFFIRAKVQGYLQPEETRGDGRQMFHYRYPDLDGMVDLYCGILDPTSHAPTIQFLRQTGGGRGFLEDKVRIDTLAGVESQIYNPETWFMMYIESKNTILPGNPFCIVNIDNYKGGLLGSMQRLTEMSRRRVQLEGIDVYDFDEEPFVKVRQRGLKEAEHLIPREQFSLYFPSA